MKRLLLLAITPLLALSILIVPATAIAACTGGNSSKSQVLDGVGQTGQRCDDSEVGSTIRGVVKIMSYILGVAAIIMILLSGFKYITSNGDSNRISAAKSTLLYAVVGLAVAALTVPIVDFVLDVTTK